MKRKPINQLYHQFLKPAQIPAAELNYFASLMSIQGFIVPYIDDQHLITHYAELEKLTSGENKKELFKLIQELKNV